MEKGIWLEIEELYKEFQQLGISQIGRAHV